MPWLLGEQSPFYSSQGLLSSRLLFQPSKCQVVSTGLCLPYFPILASPFVGGEIRIPDLNLFSHFLNPLLEMIILWKLQRSFTHLFPSESPRWGCLSLQECYPGNLPTYLLPVAGWFVLSLILAPGLLHDSFNSSSALKGSFVSLARSEEDCGTGFLRTLRSSDFKICMTFLLSSPHQWFLVSLPLSHFKLLLTTVMVCAISVLHL